ncbi:Phospho-N-acetylmuramoyl-pentapeptide-transferase [Candidatus Anstonella stagnisolia]|nr:Phospho-N-acetylmuramoyl-pentapeptide-transferase [Candidatus Anstonella stagnisolia]
MDSVPDLLLLIVLAVSFLAAFAVTLYSIPKVARKLKDAGIVGKDINKKDAPSLPEMVGITVVMGLVCGLLATVVLLTIFEAPLPSTLLFAGLCVILIISLIGIYDDLFDMAQITKALLPLAASVPLVAATISSSRTIFIPLIGPIDFGILYPLLLIPLGITVASNLTNMLAGFNGLEASLGITVFAFASLIAYLKGAYILLFFSVPMLGALVAFLIFNKYPAKVFMGDIGTLSIGATLAVAVIVGGFQSLGAILVIPYVLDFFIKAYNGFPSSKWWGELKNGKLYPVEGKVRGLCQLVMKLAGGISEQRLVLALVLFEILVGLAAFMLFIK